MEYRIKDFPEIYRNVGQMNVEELLRCVICPNMTYDNLPSYSSPTMFLHTTTADRAFASSERLSRQSSYPLVLAADLEHGAGEAIDDAVRFPSLRAAAEAGESSLAYEMGRVAAKEAIDAGFSWSFGPCVDIMYNKENPIVGLRSAGSDAETVIQYAGAYMDGMQDNGLIATLKHFPGDGYCADDQHVTTTENLLSREEWDSSYGKVYAELIQRGAMAVMAGHIALPVYDEADPVTGLYPPATLSENLLTGLLRKKLGFEGIIVSDAVYMTGFSGYMPIYRACATFLEAGGDCLLFMHETEEFLMGMKKCVDEKFLSIDVLRNRAYRMLCFVQEYAESHFGNRQVDFDREKAEKASSCITDKAVKVVRDRTGILPIKVDEVTSIAHVILFNPWTEVWQTGKELTDKFRNLAGRVDEFPDPGPYSLMELAKSGEYDYIICSIFESPSYGYNSAKLCGPAARNMMNGWMRYETPVVFISYDGVQFSETYKACTDTMINTHGITNYTIDVVMNRLLGK